MTLKSYEKVVGKISIDLARNTPAFNFCQTKPGKKFQDEFGDLIKEINTATAIRSVISFWDFYLSYIDEYFNKKSKSNSITNTLTPELFEILVNYLTETKENDFLQMLQIWFPLFLKSINSYFILALYAYIDNYFKSIYKLLMKTYSAESIVNFLTSLIPFRNPGDKFSVLSKNLPLTLSKEELGKILDKKNWQQTFKKMMKVRNDLAHVHPKVTKQVLEKNFPKLFNIAHKRCVKILNDNLKKNQNEDVKKAILKFFDKIESDLQMSFFLNEIGKACYGFIAIFDILINEFLEKKNVLYD